MTPFISTSLALLAVSPKTVLEICISPGCIADGAPLALERLSALAPSSFEIKPGTCQSLCGKGPIVIQNPSEKKIIYKRIKGDALLKLLEDDLGVSVPMALVEAYDTIGQALDATHAKVYEKAIDLYLDGIGKANSVSSDQFDKSWLCKAYRGMAEAQLGAGDLDGAGKSIQDAMKVKDDDEESLEVLISICNRKKDSAGEYEALSKLLAKPRENLPRDVANRRRTQGFRLQKLQREVGQ